MSRNWCVVARTGDIKSSDVRVQGPGQLEDIGTHALASQHKASEGGWPQTGRLLRADPACPAALKLQSVGDIALRHVLALVPRTDDQGRTAVWLDPSERLQHPPAVHVCPSV